MRTFYFLCVGICYWLTVMISSISAAPLFEEHFDTATVNGADWVQSGSGGFVFDTPPGSGSGDFAWVCTGFTGTYTNGIRSLASYNRGQNLRCTFKLWKTDESDVFGTLYEWIYNGINGPWVNRDSWVPADNDPTGNYPSLEQIEAGIARYNTADAAGAVTWCEGVTNFDEYATCPVLDPAFTTAWAAATTKANALTIRVWLGDSTGCMAEWSLDGGLTFQPLNLSGDTPIDTRDLAAGSDWNGAKVGSADPVWIFFGADWGQAWVDDIVVEDDLNTAGEPTPTPTPEPTGEPTPTPIPEVIFEEHFDVGTLDTEKWAWTGSGGGFLFDTPPGSGSEDYALVLTGSAFDGGFFSAESFDRGKNIRCTFRLWKDDQPWSFNSVCGPWYKQNTLSGDFPIYEHIEAGIGRQEGSETPAGVRWCENTSDWASYVASPMLESAFETAWGAATTKANSLMVRVWLGDETGTAAEWSQNDGATWAPLRLSLGNPIDTRGQPAGATISSSATVWLFFGGVFGQSWVDDVVVEIDSDQLPVNYAGSWILY